MERTNLTATTINERQQANYHKVWFDGLNNFYLREEDLELRRAFRLPPNIHDGFAAAGLVRLNHQIERLTEAVRNSESERAAVRQQIEALFTRRAFRWLTRFANWPELKKLTELLRTPSRKQGDPMLQFGVAHNYE